MPPGAAVAASGWMNLFPLARWRRDAHLTGLALHLAGQGSLRASLTDPARSEVPLWSAEVDLLSGGTWLPLGDLPAPPGAGLVALHLAAGDAPARLTGAAFGADPAGQAPVRLAIVITTFRRPTELAETAARITAFLEAQDPATDLGGGAHLFVIDNGAEVAPAAPAPHPRLSVIPNRNLGGAGGFARGLAAARAGGFSHVLFMDDDARMPMENLVRSAAFLRLAQSPRPAVAGAMISTAAPGTIWEMGAVFDRACRPCHGGTDLTDMAEVLAMEAGALAPRPRGFYGGFWFFAAPLAAIRHDPFPFFVRGDDISFSLANRFDIATLPGVVSLQEDFGRKESPTTLYLDLRNHLHHHLVQDGMEIGRNRSAWVALRFILRSVIRMHYASARAQLLAWEDVLAGPAMFEATADMAARRGELARIGAAEAWEPLRDPAEPPLRRPPPRIWARLMQVLLNGHLMPFWGLIGARRRIGIAQRALIWPLWGAAAAEFVDAPGGRSYAVRHDKRQAAAIFVRAWRLTRAWRQGYETLRDLHRAAYGPMTTPEAWARRFGAPDAPPDAPPDTPRAPD
jgi:GT2 family glycosyltransferase